MSGQLHEISAAIGSLQAQVHEHQRQSDLIFTGLKELRDLLAPVAVMKSTLEEIEPLVRALETDRNERNGRVGLISATVGILGAGVVEGFSALARKWGWM